tara:strand:+ start:1986 stop:2336 length:351 start_codon:yes stop_codon:yes gene_type:complete
MLHNKRLFALLIGVAFFATSCMDMSTSGGAAVDLTPLLDQQALFEKKLNQIVKKIDNLQVAVNKIQALPQAANNKKQQNKRKPADPNYVHNIPQGDSYFIGNPNAKVTITEFFDFQ